MEERRIICDHCRKLVSISKIKFIPQGKNSSVALCSNCRDKGPVIEDKTTKKPLKPVKNVEKRPQFVCDRCRFKFNVNPDSNKGIACPYCGKSDLLRRYDVNAADILVKSSNFRE